MKRIRCKNGPWAGFKLNLGLDGKTAIFTVGRLKGYYHYGVWHPVS